MSTTRSATPTDPTTQGAASQLESGPTDIPKADPLAVIAARHTRARSPRVANLAERPVQQRQVARPRSNRVGSARPPAADRACASGLNSHHGLSRPTTSVEANLSPDHAADPSCLLYTSDAADDLLCVDLGG